MCTVFQCPDLRTGEGLTALGAHVAAGRVRSQWHQPAFHHLVRKACRRHGLSHHLGLGLDQKQGVSPPGPCAIFHSSPADFAQTTIDLEMQERVRCEKQPYPWQCP